jgi:hypothetical protein
MKTRYLLPLVAAAIAVPTMGNAHCDTLDGPVVTTARTALEDGKLAPVLAWVQPGDEAEIRDAFARARAVRAGTKEARELADRWFFETVVRVHRAGEGAPFTGLKPAGTPDPAVAAADRAIATHDATQLEELLVRAVRTGMRAGLAKLETERPPGQDVAAGRRWVAAYVPFVHWAEAVHAAAAGGGAEHGAHAAPAPAHHGAAEGGAAHGRAPERGAHAH